MEVRNKSWISSEFYRLLKQCNVALAWADSPHMPLLSEKTAGFLYIRWEGNRKAVKGALGKIEVDREADLAAWGQKINFIWMASRRFLGILESIFLGIHLQM